MLSDAVSYLIENAEDPLYDCLENQCKGEFPASDRQSQLSARAGEPSPVGRLRDRIEFWEEMGASQFVLGILREGFRLPFVAEPEKRIFANHRSCEENTDFVDNAVGDLIRLGCAKEVPYEEVWVGSPLGVHTSGTKSRLILDLRYVNLHLQKMKFKYEDMKLIAQIYEKGDYVVTFDLKSGFHHIEIEESYWKYLGFFWGGKWYTFTVLPFGLSVAPWIFTKVTRVLVRYWRADGIRCAMYMDDGSGGSRPQASAQQVSRRLKGDLEQAGFIVNDRKSCWEPSDVLNQLGYVLDLKNGLLTVSGERIQKLKKALAGLVRAHYTNARELAKVAGYLLSMSMVLGPVARLWTRAIYRAIDRRSNWSSTMAITADVNAELEFWYGSLDNLHGQLIWKMCSRSLLIASDASSIGWGGCMPGREQLGARGSWDWEEMEKSSTWRELRAARLVLQSYAALIQGERVTLRLDSQPAASVLLHGSNKAHLHAEAVDIYWFIQRNSSTVEVQWVPREENQLADYYSKIVDEDDWMLNRQIFRWLDDMWGPHTLDAFASTRNAQVERFCSRWWNPGCLAIDAFTHPWENENMWLVPPIHLLPRVVRTLLGSHCHGTLVVPRWVSAPWWPMLHNGCHWIREVVAVQELPGNDQTFLPGACRWNLFGNWVPTCVVLAVRLCSTGCCLDNSPKR